MAFQVIPFSDGTTYNILTSDANLSYDATLDSIKLGSGNTLSSNLSVIFGGATNSIASACIYSGIINGDANIISNSLGYASIIASKSCTITQSLVTDDIAVGIIGSQSCTISDGYDCFIGGSATCTISHAIGGDYIEESAIVGSYFSTIQTNWAAIVGGHSNTINTGAPDSAIAGGQSNTIAVNADHSFIGGGFDNTVSGRFSVAFGKGLTISGLGSFGFLDHTLSASTLSTNDAGAFYVSKGVVIADTASVQPNSKAILTLSSTTKGFLPPVMTTTQRDAITSPVAGLMIYNSTTNHPNYYNGSAWTQL